MHGDIELVFNKARLLHVYELALNYNKDGWKLDIICCVSILQSLMLIDYSYFRSLQQVDVILIHSCWHRVLSHGSLVRDRDHLLMTH